MAPSVVPLKPNVANILLFNFCEQKFVQHGLIKIAIDCKNGPIMPLDQNPHQTVTRFWCSGFSIYACGFSVPQMQQFCLLTYPPRSKSASSEKMIFLPKSASSVSRSDAVFPKVVEAYIQSYSFGGRIKLIICQIRHEPSVTTYEISTLLLFS